jgi:hypothetical protein
MLIRISIALIIGVVVLAPVTGQNPNFDRDILPIFSDKCFHCHGPDAKARKASLRFDTKEGAFRVKDGTRVIVPGKSADSELIRRITSEDESDVMPPPEAPRKLTAQQKELLKKWIDSGAKWEQHWAFTPIQRPEPPSVRHQEWIKQPLDRFILAKLEQAGLLPGPEAPKESWLRRVTFDLTGLPPTVAELDAFLADHSPTAHETVVDLLLASPRYGERMATDWLDLARYADTHGYQMDRYRAMWPYRDWVVKAFNQNLPYDQFITWQLAGDLLPNPTKDQRLATAFNRLHMQNEEGGVVEEEFRVSYVVDRVNTFGTAFLGLTLDCTRCHDHKYDPLTMKDYYSLFSFFQNIDESGQTTYFTSSMPVPTLLLSDEPTDKKLEALHRQIKSKQEEISLLRADLATQKEFMAWLANKEKKFEIAKPTAHFPFDELEENRSPNVIDAKFFAQAHENPKLVPGKTGQAVLLDGENGLTFPKVGHFSRTDPFSISLWLKTSNHAPRLVVLHHSKAPVDAGSRGYELLLESGKIAFGLHHMWPGNSLKVVTKQSIAFDEWNQITVTYDGSSRADGLHIYRNSQLMSVDVLRDGLFKDMTYEGGEPDLTLGHRFRDNGFKNGQVDDLQIFNRELTGLEALALVDPAAAEKLWTKPLDQLTDKERDQLFEFFFETEHKKSRTLNQELQVLRKEENKVINPIPEAMVMQELPKPKPAFILKRGAYDAHGEEVTANTPGILPQFPANEPRNRLGLAHWLLEPTHPLTSRVVVNRLWQQMFGTGLVETTENFGTQGARPNNQELLDWLATEFQSAREAKPWDIKRFLKMLALSAAYRQSSRASAEALNKDPDNKLLSRYPVRRLSAEMLRDQALALSGLLVEKQGGPSVKPYQPEGLWEVAMGNPRYDRGKGPDLYRRSLYTFWKRTVPNPAMVTFDAAERNICIVRRQTTSTPLQALALLNDVQIVEAAKMLGEKIQRQNGPLNDRLVWVFRSVTDRNPSEKELTILRGLWNEQKELFDKEPAAAGKLLATGDAKVDPKLLATELAANTILALTLLNHDEAVMRR